MRFFFVGSGRQSNGVEPHNMKKFKSLKDVFKKKDELIEGPEVVIV